MGYGGGHGGGYYKSILICLYLKNMILCDFFLF